MKKEHIKPVLCWATFFIVFVGAVLTVSYFSGAFKTKDFCAIENYYDSKAEQWKQQKRIEYGTETWPTFTVEYDSGYLEIYSGGAGRVTINLSHLDVNIRLGGKLKHNMSFYMQSGVWMSMSLIQPENISYNITIVKEIEDFFPYIDNPLVKFTYEKQIRKITVET
jgi:hypothetical protein